MLHIKLLLFACISFRCISLCCGDEFTTNAARADYTPDCRIDINFVTANHSLGAYTNFTCQRNGLTGSLVARFSRCHMTIKYSDGLCTVNKCNIPIIRSDMHYDLKTNYNDTCNKDNMNMLYTTMGGICSWLRPDCKTSPSCLVPSTEHAVTLMDRYNVVKYSCRDRFHANTIYECNYSMPDIWYRRTKTSEGGDAKILVPSLPTKCYKRQRGCSRPPSVAHTVVEWSPPFAYYYCLDGYGSDTARRYNMSIHCDDGKWYSMMYSPFKCVGLATLSEAKTRRNIHMNSDIVLFVSVCGSILLLIITLLLAGYAKRCQQRHLIMSSSSSEHATRTASRSSRSQERCARSRSSRSGSSRRRRLMRSLSSTLPPDYTILPEHQINDPLGRMTPMVAPPLITCVPPSYTSSVATAASLNGSHAPPSYIVTVSETVPSIDVGIDSSISSLAHTHEICTDYTLRLIQ